MKLKYDEAFKKALAYYNGDSLSAKTFVDKYALRDPDGLFDEAVPTDMQRRMAKELARVEAKYPNPRTEEEIFHSLEDFRYCVPQGSPMYGIGNPYNVVSLSNCFVIQPPGDTISDIIEAGKDMANIMKRRGGVGVDITKLRPDGAPVNNAARTSTGAWSFADFYSYVCRMIGQCLAGDSLVQTQDKGLLSIADVRPGQFVWTKAGWVKVLARPNNGPKQLYKLTDSNGFEIRASADHVFVTVVGGQLIEKPLKDFTVGDKIVLIPGKSSHSEYQSLDTDINYPIKEYNNSNRLATGKLPNLLKEDLAYLLGYSYGDGFVEWDKFGEPLNVTVACAHDWPEITEQVKDAARTGLNVESSTRPGDGALDRVSVAGKWACLFLQKNGLLKGKSEKLTFPEKVLRSPPAVQAAFIAGYFDADGYASGKKRGYCMSSVDLDFLKKVQVVLMSNGIVSKIHKEDRSALGWRTLHTLAVVGSYAQTLLVEFLHRSVKVRDLNHVSKRDNYLTPFTARSLGVKYNNYDHVPGPDAYLSVNCFSRLKTEAGLNLPEVVIQSTVSSIETDSVETTYDLCLASEHLFFSQGFQVHNSGRRGALMITIDVRHPDVFQFVRMKKDLTKVTGANVSVKICDEFMNAVVEDTTFDLRWPVDSESPSVVRTIKAKELWDELIVAAHASAEPGLLMWDNIIRELPAHRYPTFQTVSTNPCGEIPLSPEDACRLLALNLKSFVKHPFTAEAYFDFELFKSQARLGQRLMDDIVDLELEAVDKIRSATNDPSEKALWDKVYKRGEDGRRTGLGTFGLADALACLQLRYDSDDALKVVHQIYSTFRDAAYLESVVMAEERGSFKVWDWELEKDCPFLQRLPVSLKERMQKVGRRNISLLTNAPTGSVSICAFNSSSGIEPVFRNAYKRRKKINHSDGDARVDFVDHLGDKWQEFDVYHRNAADWIKLSHPEWDGLSSIKLPEYFVQSDEINWQRRVELQGVIQQYIDHSISSTINLPSSVTVDVVGQLYIDAWRKGLKGVTIYVDGSRTGVLVSDSGSAKDKEGRPTKLVRTHAPKRPDTMPCDVQHVSIQGEPWVILVGLMESEPYEIFGGPAGDISVPKAVKSGYLKKMKVSKSVNKYLLVYEHQGSEHTIEDVANVFHNKNYTSFTRVLSLSLRHGAPVQHIVEQLTKDENEEFFGFARVLSRVLKKYISDGTKAVGRKCDRCSSTNLKYQDGCPTCLDCGNTKCY